LTRNLSGHKLLQAIARVNRLHDDKDFGYIVDYYGVIENLDEALGLYGSFEDFDAEDLEGTFVNIHEEIQKLPQKHSDVWEIFKTIANKRDVEAFQVLLKDEAIRTEFYDKLTIFAKAFKLALSAIEFHEQTPEKDIDRYKNDLAMFLKLRSAVMARYSDVVDYKQYEGQIQKLIDTHITTDKVETITSLVNIFDQEAFQAELEKTLGTAAKADKITSRTAKHISEKMEDDPAFYKKFSEMLKDTIADYETNRIDETQYLERGQHIMQAVLSRTDSDIPETLQTREVARAFYGLVYEMLKNETRSPELNQEIGIQTAFAIDEIVLQHVKVNWQNEIDTPKKMIYLIGEYLLDEVRDAHHIPMGFSEIDDLAEKCVEVAKRRYAR
jgi:type I restriction enzyme R subunit